MQLINAKIEGAVGVLTGEVDPASDTAGKVGQHYINTKTKKEFVCVAADTEAGNYEWQSSGASSADDLTYGDKKLSAALDEMSKSIDASKALTGGVPPSEKTTGTVGQKYTDLSTGNTYVCTQAEGETYTWVMENDGAMKGKQDAIKVSGLLKGGEKGVEKAQAGVDFQPPTKGLEKGDSLGREDMIPVYSPTLKGDRAVSLAVLKDALGVQSPTIVVTTCTGATVTCEGEGESMSGTGNCKFSLTKPGSYTVKAELSGVTAQQVVEVTGALQYNVDLMLLSEISASGVAEKSAYYAGESFSPTGLTINATYADKTKEDVTAQCTFSPDPLTFGTSQVTIAYTRAGVKKTCTQAVTVSRRSVAIPSQTGSVTFNGSSRTPAWNGYDQALMTISGETSAINSGEHEVRFTLNDTSKYQWSNGSIDPQTVRWTMAKAAGSLTLSAQSLSLTMSNKTGQILVTRAGDGAITAQSSAGGTASVEVQGNNVVVTGKATGNAVITVKVAEGTNHLAPKDQTFSVSVDFSAVFGVCWNTASTSTTLSRLTSSNDPNKLVTVNIASDPKPAEGTGSGSSPFDAYLPWSGMEEYNIDSSGTLTKKGAAGFSRSEKDTMVYIPEFWYKITESGGKRYFYIANAQKSGFTKHPGSGKYVGRYNTGAGYVSKSGIKPLVSITRAAARTGSKNKGSKWSQYDFASWCAVWLLYLVEFADWDSQSTIGRGYVDGNSAAANTGGTDSMSYHTGRAAGTNGKTQVQYRHIEDPWGNVFEWIDGINFDGGTVYVSTTPANYADDVSANYTNVGTKSQTDGYIKSLGLSTNMPWAFFPSATGGSETTYVPDYAYYNSGWRVLFVGGRWDNGSDAGLFYFNANNASSYSSSNIGARLLYHP